jgi:uncharacterized lipoprotein YajG
MTVVLLIMTAFSLSACTSIIASKLAGPTRVTIEHTPITDIKKIAVEEENHAVMIGEITDVRKKKLVAYYKPMPGALGEIDLKIHVGNDVAAVVREAMQDGLSKAGFRIDASSGTPSKGVYIKARILKMATWTKSRGLLKNVDTHALIVMEISLINQINQETKFTLEGEFIEEKTDSNIVLAKVGPNFDLAINNAVKKLLEEPKFLDALR